MSSFPELRDIALTPLRQAKASKDIADFMKKLNFKAHKPIIDDGEEESPTPIASTSKVVPTQSAPPRDDTVKQQLANARSVRILGPLEASAGQKS